VAQLTRVALLLPGFVFFWTLLRVDPVPRAYPYIVTLWITAAEVVGDAVLGIAVIASTSLLAGPYYHALARPWGPTLATSQVLGGGVLWILGDIVGLPFLAAQFIQMIREDEADAEAVDAELDAQEAEAAGAAVALAAAPVDADGASEMWLVWRAGQASSGRGGRPTAGSPTGSAPSTTLTRGAKIAAGGQVERSVRAADQERPADG
jgi:hypothetical protein